MPTYQYACTACGHQLEAVQSFADEPLTECPTCEGRLRKLFSAVGVVFKGSGFYRTDSRTGPGSASAAAKDGAASKDSAAKDSGSKDSSSKDSSAPAKESTAAKSETSASSPKKDAAAPAAA
ncbi:MAG: FmdB family transcriptional regulator [Actinobacteria bacterium 13_2_20CM_2_71_6]|nr:MAG: FmdB family transcriptional regulator [Actinobacteria bacterium 13_2_20CM_2_71_6]